MTTQTTIFGEDVKVSSDVKETELILATYPAAARDPSMFFWLVLKHRHPWVSQLPEARQNELKHFCDDLESLRRRRQQAREKDDQAKV